MKKIETGKIYRSIAEATRAACLKNSGSMRNAIAKEGCAAGCHWEYVDCTD